MLNRFDTEHRLFLQWLTFFGVLLFSAWLAWERGWLGRVFEHDPTRLSLIISCLFVGATLHCALRARFLSGQLNEIRAIRLAAERGERLILAGARLKLGQRILDESLPEAYLSAVLGKYRSAPGHSGWHLEHAQLTEVLAEQARGQHEMGWFITGLLIKLGLLGTVIGFVLMLGSIATIESFDVSDVQNVLQKMTVGMGIALNTTLVGLAGSMLLGFQYLLLDRGADRLVADTIHFAEVHLVPEHGAAA